MTTATRRVPWDTAAAALAVVAAAAVVRFVLPSHAPNGVVLQGVFEGLRLALVAGALLVVWRSSRIINFAVIALAVVAPTMFFDFGMLGVVGVGRFPWLLALLLGLALGVLFAGLIEITFVRRFFAAPRLVLTLITVIAAPVVGSLAAKFTANIPLFAHDTRYNYLQLHQSEFHPPFRSWGFEVFPLHVGFVQLLDVVVSLGALLGLVVFFRRSRLGAALTGASENPDRALLLGINVRLLSTVAWCIAGLLGSLYGVLDGMDYGTYTGRGTGSADSVVALTIPLVALALARMQRLSVATLMCVALAILAHGLVYAYPTSQASPVILLVLLVGSMFFQRSGFTRDDRGLTAAAETAREQRPIPAVLAGLAGVRLLRGLALALALAVALIFPYVVTVATASAAAKSLAVGVIVLSLVVITGWGGLISLGQMAIAAVGALVYANLVGSAHWPWLLALPVAVVSAAAVSLAVGQPALRLRGPFLPVITLVFALAVQAVLFGSPLTTHIVPPSVPSPRLPFFSTEDRRHYYYFCLGMAALVAFTVRRLRASRVGRVLVAIREDEHGVQPFGISSGRSRIAVFVLSGAIAGLGGALLAPLLGPDGLVPKAAAPFPSFSVAGGVQLVVLALVGGTTSVLGALLAAIYFCVISVVWVTDYAARDFATNTALAALLFINPGGISALLFAARDSLLRVVALRRRILVPGLLREVEISSLRDGRAPLASASEGRGLAALPPHRRYSRESALYPSARNLEGPGRRPLAQGGTAP